MLVKITFTESVLLVFVSWWQNVCFLEDNHDNSSVVYVSWSLHHFNTLASSSTCSLYPQHREKRKRYSTLNVLLKLVIAFLFFFSEIAICDE